MIDLPPDWGKFAFWGMAGGIAVLGLEFWTSVRALDGHLPERCKRIPYWVGEAVRVAIGGILAVALGGASQVTAPLGALTVGVATPLVIARLTESLPPFNPNPKP